MTHMRNVRYPVAAIAATKKKREGRKLALFLTTMAECQHMAIRAIWL